MVPLKAWETWISTVLVDVTALLSVLKQTGVLSEVNVLPPTDTHPVERNVVLPPLQRGECEREG